MYIHVYIQYITVYYVYIRGAAALTCAWGVLGWGEEGGGRHCFTNHQDSGRLNSHGLIKLA